MDLEAGSVGDPYDAGGARLSFSAAAGSGRLGGISRIRAIATQRVRLRRMQSSGALNEAEASVSGGYANVVAAEQSVRFTGQSVRGGSTSLADVDAMSGAELSAAALAAAKRNAASARDVALCLGIADSAPLLEAGDGEQTSSAAARACWMMMRLRRAATALSRLMSRRLSSPLRCTARQVVGILARCCVAARSA
jgi:hypothetical protein